MSTNKPCRAPYQSYLHAYWQQIQSGRVLAGRHIRQGVRRLLDDFDNPELRVELADSDKRIRFIEHECRHSEAPFAGKPFRLEIWQKAIIESIFAIKMWSEEAGRWVRKYQEFLIVIARKNGKTPLVAAIALSEFVCGDMGTKVLFGSNDYDQADLLFQAANAMREESPKLARCTRKNLQGIYFGNPRQHNKRGKFSYQNKGSIRKISANGKNKEGRNIKVGAVDEVHEMADNSLVEPIRQALSTQDEPIYFEITTEGFTDDGYLDMRLAEAEKVLSGERPGSRWAIWWFGQDSEEEVWQNPASWVKSNPGLGAIKKWSYLEGKVEEARSNPSTRAFVLAKDFNIKQNSAVAWLDAATIINPQSMPPEEFRGMYYIGGLDFAETNDLCSARAYFMHPETRMKYTMAMYFIPETKADIVLEDTANVTNPEKKDYREWEKQGLVTICPGGEVSTQMVVDWFVGLYDAYKMEPYRIGYDNWHAQDFKRLAAEKFGDEVLERIGMDFMSLSGPMRTLESDLKLKRIVYNNNPVDRWCLENTSLKTNNIGLIMPVKKYGQSKNRIDGTLSMIICQAAMSRYQGDYETMLGMR